MGKLTENLIERILDDIEKAIDLEVKPSYSVDSWLRLKKITPEDMELYPLAKEAFEIKNSPLYKALEEEDV